MTYNFPELYPTPCSQYFYFKIYLTDVHVQLLLLMWSITDYNMAISLQPAKIITKIIQSKNMNNYKNIKKR